jgi:hypothetical protein
MMVDAVKVPWVVVRRLALARAMAIREAKLLGQDWMRLPSATRDRMVADAEKAINEWTRAEVAIQFLGEYREAEDGGQPLVDWTKAKAH